MDEAFAAAELTLLHALGQALAHESSVCDLVENPLHYVTNDADTDVRRLTFPRTSTSSEVGPSVFFFFLQISLILETGLPVAHYKHGRCEQAQAQ